MQIHIQRQKTNVDKNVDYIEFINNSKIKEVNQIVTHTIHMLTMNNIYLYIKLF